MEKSVILSFLKELKVAHFEENVSGSILEPIILGTLEYQDYAFFVKLNRDAVCQYICLEYSLNDVKDVEDVVRSIEEWIIAGRYIVNGTNIILRSFFPIFEGKFFEQQINHSICVIEKMIHICKH